MNPILIKIQGHTKKSAQEMCQEFLNLERWSEFKGYSILPGIESAEFEIKTANLPGSRIKVHNTDGSSHVEEIIEWDENHKLAVRFQDMEPPLKYLATHFIEEWLFVKTPDGTDVTRSMSMYPRGLAGWLVLLPIAQLMKKAFEKNMVLLREE